VLAMALNSITQAQSTATLEGIVTDATGAVVSGAAIQAHNTSTGEERTVVTDAAGAFVLPSLPLGSYRVSASSSGMQTMVANNVVLEVGRTAEQNFTLRVATSAETIEVTGVALSISTESLATNAVIDAQTVQEIPLNGRHFLDMGFLTPGSVTPPANAGLAAPLRGQGFFSFNSAGAREDEVNFMLNGINLSDPNNNQITFQPTIATVSEFKVDNSTYSAEYGRNSGAIVNIATRSGTNEFHGEVYEYFRNHDLDARNWANPIGVTQSPFHRNQFGGDAGGKIKKDVLLPKLRGSEASTRSSAVHSGALAGTARASAGSRRPDHPEAASLDPAAQFAGEYFCEQHVGASKYRSGNGEHEPQF